MTRVTNPTIAIGFGGGSFSWHVFGQDPEDGSYLDGPDHAGFDTAEAALTAARVHYPQAPVICSDTARQAMA